METIKKYLQEKVSDENRIKDFLEMHETEIKEFIINLWEKRVIQPVENQQQIGAVTDKKLQTQTDMPKVFDSGEKPDKEKAQSEALAFQIKNKPITFLNGKVGKEYDIDFDFEKLDFADIAEISFDGLEKIGVRYFPEEKKIKGIPTEAGDHKVTMKFKRKDWTEGKPILQREVVFIINPDPKSLWKNIPTPEDIEYYKPDSDKAFLKIESKIESKCLGLKKTEIARKDMVAASQRGRSHAIEGKPRDDDFALYFDNETEWYVMVVADGAGSAPFSRRGSQIACTTAKDICSKHLAKDGISDVLDLAINEYYKESLEKNRSDLYKTLHSEVLAKAAWEAYSNIYNEAAEKQRKPKEYATTLLLSICKKFDFGWFVGAFWVGDGGIGIYRKEPQELKVLGEPDGGEFAGQTRFLTMPEIFSDRVRTRFEIVEDFTAVILMSDGVTDPKFETDANLNRIEKWNELWDDLNGNNEDNLKIDFSDDNEQTAEQLLKWLDFWSKGNHDDRTIAILF
ncbi:MAG: protein phosphatase 2C domain-containing protein [Dysgonamonadaceae bacterium]|nr:protein phosphatase 2C domain-containing protein [Dysgonamonadaceae bacterium]